MSLPLGIDPHQLQLLPAPLDNVLDAQIELTTHDDGIGFAGELVEEVEANGVDLVVDVEAAYSSQQEQHSFEAFARSPKSDLPFDVFSMILHDHVDEIIYRGCEKLI